MCAVCGLGAESTARTDDDAGQGGRPETHRAGLMLLKDLSIGQKVVLSFLPPGAEPPMVPAHADASAHTPVWSPQAGAPPHVAASLRFTCGEEDEDQGGEEDEAASASDEAAEGSMDEEEDEQDQDDQDDGDEDEEGPGHDRAGGDRKAGACKSSKPGAQGGSMFSLLSLEEDDD